MTSHRWAAVLLILAGCEPTFRAPDEARAARADAIIGGVVEPSHWYVVMVGNTNGGSCTGTLISKRTVITAGHCRTGMNSLSRVFFDTGNPLVRTTVTATSSVRHPQYNGTAENDLSLVQLSQDAPVQPVPILRETMITAPPWIGPKYTFVGYGDTNAMGTGFGTRRVVRFPIMLVGPSNVTHPGPVPQGSPTAIDGSEWYYRVSGKNTCFGDSGGPGFVIRNGVERHAGATSYGDFACAYDGVQAKTDATTMSWIQNTIDLWEGADPCKADGVCGASCVSTTPAPRGTITDPDCADQHCGADGVCVLSCADADPDCSTLNINDCAENGICETGCTPADPDCTTGTGTLGTTCSAGSDCATGFCANGVCCDQACNRGCEACSAAGACTAKPPAVCRPSAGVCDVEESCNGTSGACPADGFAAPTQVCRMGTATCDAPETCTGTSATCPPDAFAGPSTICRPPVGPCDTPETCTGAGLACPPDGFRPQGYVCHGALGLCDVSEVCSGASSECPPDVKVPAGAVCRQAQGACDVDEKCAGGAVDCPADGFAAPGTVCRQAFSTCDAIEVCSGTTELCPTDGLAPEGQACPGGTCGGGLCVPKPITVVDAGPMIVADAGTTAKVDAGTTPSVPQKGCGCSSGAGLWLALAGLPLLRRKKR